MQNKQLLTATLLLAGLATHAQAELVGYWNFNTFDPATDTTLPADDGSGNGEIDLDGWEGDVANFDGDSTNTRSGDPADDSLSLRDDDGNGSFIEITFSMSGLEDLDVSYWTRRTGTGFDSNQWSYSTDGVTFTDFGPEIDPINDSGGELLTLPTLTALDDASTAYLRYTLDGATSGSGNNRLDNLQLNATIIPEPGSLALLGLGGLALLRFRRGRARV